MKKLIQKISSVLQVVLMAPVKLLGRALNIIKYIALGLGVVETVLDVDERKKVAGDDHAPEDVPADGHAAKEKEVSDET
jgi:hypothetical protein